MLNDLSPPPTDLKAIFRSCASYWQQRQKDIFRVANEIENDLAGRLSDAQREVLAARRLDLGNAVQGLADHARSPELVIATTGTTSSGKSTLANFLIGEDILPAAVQEMSAGVVTIRHHEKRHTLKIPSTRGAQWETGEWDDLSADMLRQKLASTMTAFREAEREDPSIEPVRFEIDWPIRLARQSAKFSLPPSTRVTIVDLPGLKAISDERNGPIIKENVRQALCLVAYNSEETDKQKQQALLNQVVAQVMELRQGPDSVGRMLFLLNRVDAFIKDANPAESLASFKDEVTGQLHEGLLAKLPEERAVIERIEPTMISSLPALWAVEAGLPAITADSQQILLDKIESHFKSIFPQNYWKSIPRDLAELSDDGRRHLIDDTLRHSRAYDFEERLGRHIASNLPEIVLAGPWGEADAASSAFLTAIDQMLNAHETRTVEEATALKRRVTDVGDELNKLGREIQTVLLYIARLVKKNKEEAADGVSLYFVLQGSFDELGRRLGKPGLMDPAKEFGANSVGNSFKELQAYCESAMEDKRPAPSPLLAGVASLKEFDEALDHLRQSPYGAVFEQGGAFRSGAEADAVKKAILGFAEQLSVVAGLMTSRAAAHFGKSLEIAYGKCADLMLVKLEDRAKKGMEQEFQSFPGLAGLFNGKITVPPFKETQLNFSARIEEWQSVEKREESETYSERRWYSLWLYRHLATTSVIRSYDVSGIQVPGLGALLESMFHSGEMEPLWANFSSYIIDVTEILVRHVEGRIDDIVDGYTKAIDESVDKIDQNADYRKEIIRRSKEAIAKLANYQNWLRWEDITLQETGETA